MHPRELDMISINRARVRPKIIVRIHILPEMAHSVIVPLITRHDNGVMEIMSNL